MQGESISLELALLIHAATGKSDPPNAESFASLNWTRFLKLSKWHQVRPLAFELLQNFPESVPEAEYAALKDFTFGQAVTNMAFLGISTRLLTELKSAGVAVFPMKGALWAWMLYAKPTLREFGDIDYFIKKEDVQKSLEVLLSNGFAPDAYRTYLFEMGNGGAAYLDTDYQLPLSPIQEHTLQSLEIQWNCSYPRYYFDFRFEELMQNAVDFQIGGKTMQVPSPENQLIMMLIHHGGVEQWDKLKYAGDLVRLLHLYADKIDWHDVVKAASSRGFKRMLINALRIATLLTGRNYVQYVESSGPAPSWQDPFMKEIVGHWENGRPPLKTKSWSIFTYNLRYRDDFQTKALICLKHLEYLFQWRLLWHKLRWYRQRKFTSAKQ